MLGVHNYPMGAAAGSSFTCSVNKRRQDYNFPERKRLACASQCGSGMILCQANAAWTFLVMLLSEKEAKSAREARERQSSLAHFAKKLRVGIA